MCGVETLAPLLLNEVHTGRLTINQVVQLLSENPAKLYGIDNQKGTLMPGTDADITIVDLKKEGTIQKANLHSKSKISAYDGRSIIGWPVRTIVHGHTVMEDGNIVNDQPKGQLVKPGR